MIIYLLIAEEINRTDFARYIEGGLIGFKNLRKAIDEYYNNAFTPEIKYAINFAEQSKRAAEILAKYCKASASKVEDVSFSEARFQLNLLYIQRKFEDTFRSLRLKRNHVLFIDGIDIRPDKIPYDDYLECVKGLANAVWTINTDFFSSIKSSEGRLRVVLLLRPDIFQSLGLQNQGNKVVDNSVLLDWRTTYPDCQNSALFAMTDRLLSAQQTETVEIGQAFSYYFPYHAIDTRSKLRKDSPFVTFLRFSLFRPRDMISMLQNLQQLFIEQRRGEKEFFREEDFDSPVFRRRYSEYLATQVKDHISFYHNISEYQLFLKFFEFLQGNFKFTYDQYIMAYNQFIQYLKRSSIPSPMFFDTPDNFLQFLFDLNVICYVEDTRDESYVN